jgi:hypothetical protein
MKSKSFCSLIAWSREGKIKQNSTGRFASALLLACTVGVFGYAGSAKASVYNFSYEYSTGDILSGQFNGTISSGDSNVLEVSSVVNAFFNSVAGPSLPILLSASDFLFSSGTPPLVSFDGSVMDIVYADTLAADDGFVFLDATFAPPNGAVNTGPSFGNFTPGEEFVRENWSLTAVSETPLPASFPLFATGLGAMGLLGWRRKRKKVALAA